MVGDDPDRESEASGSIRHNIPSKQNLAFVLFSRFKDQYLDLLEFTLRADSSDQGFHANVVGLSSSTEVRRSDNGSSEDQADAQPAKEAKAGEGKEQAKTK